MKVLQIIQRYPPAVGGSETWCREISRYLADHGDEVKVLTLDVLEEEEYWQDLPAQKCTVRLGRIDWDGRVQVRRFKRSLPIPLLHHLIFERLLNRLWGIYFSGPHSIEMYGKMFAEVRAADVVHLNTLPYPHNLVGLLAAKLFRKRIVITPHFHPGHPHYELWSICWLLKQCDRVLPSSTFERDYLISKGIDPAKIVVTGVGIHLDDYDPKDLEQFKMEFLRKHHITEETKFVIFVGRKAEYKDLPILIEAVQYLKAKYNIVLLLVGPSLEWFNKFYASMSSEEKRYIIDLGQVSHQEKVNLLYLADVLVLPSPFESFGIVFLEAWVCGTPVIGTENQAVAELVEGGGLTFQTKNVRDLAAKIETLLNDKRLAQQMVIQGKAKVIEKYRWEKLGAIVRKAYRLPRHSGMRILICSNLFPPHSLGGSEVVAYKQGKILQELGHEVRIFCGRFVNNPLQRYKVKIETGEFHTTWIGITPQDLGGQAQSLLNEQVRREFARVLDEFLPDVVHFHNVTGLSIQVIDACREKSIPTVMTLHDYWGICFKNLMIKNDGGLCLQSGFDCLGCMEVLSGDPPLPSPVRNAHILLALRRIDRFISPSHYLAERFIANGLPGDKMRVIRNGIDLDGFQRVPKQLNGFTIGYVGQLIRHKGVDFLLRSLSLLKNREKVETIIVGDGEEAGYLKSLCHELDLDQRVTFAGRVDNRRIAAFYEKIDALVVPSIWPENSPVVITEAMASGIPVIASDMGGIRELVEDGVTGFLIRPRDVGALADKIEYLLNHPEVRRWMGEKAAAKIKEHELRGQVEKVLGLYQELLQQERDGAIPDSPEILLYHAGTHWDLRVREAIYQVAELEKHAHSKLLLCRIELADDELIASAKLLLIPSAGHDSFRYALKALRRGIPVIVHEDAWELKELCLASNAGLFYSSPEEVRACLEILLTDESLRQAMGAKGREFVVPYVG